MTLYLVLAVAVPLGIYAIDMLLRWSLRLMSRYYPSEVAGPDGWLVDTRSKAGVFDK